MAQPRNFRKSNDVSMPFLAHLEELRQRLFYCAIAILVGGVATYVLFTQIPGFDLLEFLARPATRYLNGEKLIVTGAMDIFHLQINAGFIMAMIIASPVIGYQLWSFIAPAMYVNEKRIAIPVIGSAVALFLSGVALCYYLVLPLTMEFFLGIQTEAAVPMLTLKDFIDLEIFMCVGFGVAFQLPIFILGLSAIGLVTPTILAKGRRFAIVGVLVVSAAITPDPTTMFLMSIPLYGLYEISISLSKIVYRWRQRREEERDKEENNTPSSSEPSASSSSREEPLRLGSPS